MKSKFAALLFFVFASACMIGHAAARDLADIKKAGVLRHLGVPYANFVTGDGQGLDVEVMQLFAKEIGVKYLYVKTSWKDVIPDLTGKQVESDGDNVKITGEAPIRGDVIANGLTILPWRQKVLDFSAPTFPTQVWLVAGPQSSIKPIVPSGSIDGDIAAMKRSLAGKKILGKNKTCLDPKLYFLEDANAVTSLFEGDLNELAPAVISGVADATLLDVPDALVALDKWPDQIKILGPISRQQEMAVAFSKDMPELRQAFAVFLKKIWQDGTYTAMVTKYYPDVFGYYPDFFTLK
ncbi:MAG: transporter substrate-binding domain-containing protein [Desulfobulbaceae bacterium]|jgi:ABC-type amino acid transport substrate-binding protein|nr:transporter substrate-binding domain-containing protein [Desulfobulbaceae bacterium]